MKSHQKMLITIWMAIFTVGTFAFAARPPTSVPKRTLHTVNYSQLNQSLPNGFLAWDAVTKSAKVTDNQRVVHFAFDFTNISDGAVTILGVHPSCGCTTAQLPPVPWRIPAASSGKIRLSVNLPGTVGTLLKTVNVSTDKGFKMLDMRITVHSQPIPKITEAERRADIAVAKRDRQAVFKGNCASCHLRDVEGRYGKAIYADACAICHDAKSRASMVPDLHHLNVPTDVAFWRSWIASGKAGTLMPAFAAAQGGPLSDMQIATLASYLNATIPSRVHPTAGNSQMRRAQIYKPAFLKH